MEMSQTVLTVALLTRIYLWVQNGVIAKVKAFAFYFIDFYLVWIFDSGHIYRHYFCH